MSYSLSYVKSLINSHNACVKNYNEKLRTMEEEIATLRRENNRLKQDLNQAKPTLVYENTLVNNNEEIQLELDNNEEPINSKSITCNIVDRLKCIIALVIALAKDSKIDESDDKNNLTHKIKKITALLSKFDDTQDHLSFRHKSNDTANSIKPESYNDEPDSAESDSAESNNDESDSAESNNDESDSAESNNDESDSSESEPNIELNITESDSSESEPNIEHNNAELESESESAPEPESAPESESESAQESAPESAQESAQESGQESKSVKQEHQIILFKKKIPFITSFNGVPIEEYNRKCRFLSSSNDYFRHF